MTILGISTIEDQQELVTKVNALWEATPGGAGAVPEAPNDGKIYGRLSLTWVESLKKNGDVMTGDLEIAKASPGFILDKAASGQAATITAQMNNLNRWQVRIGDTVAEGGANAGSNFVIARYDDAGTIIDTPFSLNRASGGAGFGGNISISKATPQLSLIKPAGGSAATIAAYNVGNLRWAMELGNASAESGANNGSNFTLNRYTDAGALAGTPLNFSRATGLGTVAADPTAALGIATKQYVDAADAKRPVLLSTTAIPAAAAVVEITGLNSALYRTYEFFLEYAMPNANDTNNNLVCQLGDASAYISGAVYANFRSIDTLGAAVATFTTGDALSFCNMGSSFGTNAAPAYGRLLLQLPPPSIGAGSFARLSGELMYSGAAGGLNYICRFTSVVALSASDTTRIQFFIWNGSAVQSWKNPTTPYARILCYGVPG